MKKSRFSEQQIAFILKQAEDGTTVLVSGCALNIRGISGLTTLSRVEPMMVGSSGSLQSLMKRGGSV